MRSFGQPSGDTNLLDGAATQPTLFPNIDWYEFSINDDERFALVNDLFNAIRALMIARWDTYCSWISREPHPQQYLCFDDNLTYDEICAQLYPYLANDQTLDLLDAELRATTEDTRYSNDDKQGAVGALVGNTMQPQSLLDEILSPLINEGYWVPLGISRQENIARLEYLIIEDADCVPVFMLELIELAGEIQEKGQTTWEEIRGSPWPLIGEPSAPWTLDKLISLLDQTIHNDPIKQSYIWTIDARVAIKEADFGQARLAGKQAVALNPANAIAWYELWDALYHLKFWDEGVIAAQTWTQLQPENVGSWVSLADMQCNAKQYGAALESSEQALTLDATSAEGWAVKGWALHGLNRYEDSVGACERALKYSNNRDGGAWTTLSGALSHLKRYQEALAASDKAIRLHGGAAAWSNRSVVFYWLERYKEAIEASDHAIARDPDYPNGWLNKGVSLHKLERYDEAIVAYQKACELDPSYGVAWYNLGLTLAKVGRSEEALIAKLQACKFNQTDASRWYSLGLTYWTLERYEEALEACEHALALDAEDTSAWSLKGLALSKVGRLSEAYAAVSQAARFDPSNTKYQLQQGELLEKMERFEEAVEINRRLIALSPNELIAWARLAYALWILSGDPNELLAAAKRTVELDATYAYGWILVGVGYGQLQQYIEAQQAYQRALDLDASSTSAARGVAWALYAQDKIDDAVAAYRAALQQHPTNTAILDDLVQLCEAQGFNEIAAITRAKYHRAAEGNNKTSDSEIEPSA